MKIMLNGTFLVTKYQESNIKFKIFLMLFVRITTKDILNSKKIVLIVK